MTAERQEIIAEREIQIVIQLQEHLAESQAQVEDWNFWYRQEYGSEYEMLQEDQDDEGETAEVNQMQPLVPAVVQEQPLLVTPPVVQRHVPPELLPPRQIPSSIAPLPPVQPHARDQPPLPPPPPPPLEPPPRDESTQTSQAVQQAQGEPSVPSQQLMALELGPAAPMTQGHVLSRGVNPVPATPTACLQGGVAPGVAALQIHLCRGTSTSNTCWSERTIFVSTPYSKTNTLQVAPANRGAPVAFSSAAA